MAARSPKKKAPLRHKDKDKAKKKMGWGGARPGAGRPPSPDSGVSHHRRGPVSRRDTLYVKVPLLDDLPSLTSREAKAALQHAFWFGSDYPGLTLLGWSIRGGMIHVLAKAKDRKALGSGLQALLIRVSRQLNRAWGRKGTVLADRYDDEPLKTKAERAAADKAAGKWISPAPPTLPLATKPPTEARKKKKKKKKKKAARSGATKKKAVRKKSVTKKAAAKGTARRKSTKKKSSKKRRAAKRG